MQTSLFSFELPEELIARFPPEKRGTSRLMVLERDSGNIYHRKVTDLPDLTDKSSLIIFNDTRVRKARVFAVNAETGGRGEFLFIEPVAGRDAADFSTWDCVVDKARKKRIGQKWLFPGSLTAEITEAPAGDRRIITFEKPLDESWFEQYGHIPLPPYMKREDEKEDSERYQTVYAKNTGSAAAPTAGLHFTPDILESLEEKGIQIGWVTLNVGLGTFAPVRTEHIEDHSMHTERYNVPDETAELVNKAKKEKRNIIAVGTTSLRTLESAWDTETGKLRRGEGATDIFIYPGYKFKVVNQLFTNFHTPESTLLMLVSAFCGRDKIINAYKTAVQMRYRFFSYGDAMFIK